MSDDNAPGTSLIDRIRAPKPATAVLTLPNIISLMRLILIALIVYFMSMEQDTIALVCLAVAAVSDFVDGALARKWNQQTELGRILDPLADRLLTIAVVLSLTIRDILPLWIAVLLLLRDAVVGLVLVWGRRRGVEFPQVTYLGKVTTFGLFFFLPLTYLVYPHSDTWHTVALIGVAVFGLLYWYTAEGYLRTVVQQSRESGQSRAHDGLREG